MAKGICAIIPSDIPNPAVDEPVPAYARAWDPTMQRPTHLPEDYDERIAPEFIFFLPAGPEETANGLTQSGVYVVAKKCDHCERLRKACSRARPTCQMCLAGRHDCVTSDAGYVHLSGPKGTRPSRIKGAEPGQPAQHGRRKVRASARAQTEDVPDTKSTHPRLRTLRLRSGTASRESLPPPDSRSPSPTLSEGFPRRAKTAPHENEGRRNASPKPVHEAKASKKRKAKLFDSHSVSAGPSRPKKSKVDATTSSGTKVSSTRKKQTADHDFHVTGHDEVRPWIVVQPPTGPTEVALFKPYSPPRIWANSKEELLGVVPTLKNEVNRVVWGNVEAPVLFLQGPTWPADKWDGQKAVEFTMVRRCLRHQSSPRQIDLITAAGAQGHELHSRLPSVSVSGPDQPARSQPVALHPSAYFEGLPAASYQRSRSPEEPCDLVPSPYSAQSPNSEANDRVISPTSPHPAPLSLLCEASSLAETLSATPERAQDLSSRSTISKSPARRAGSDSFHKHRSRSSSVSSGMNYDEARDLSGSSYTTTLTSVCSWTSDYLKPSLADTRFRTSSVRDEPEGGAHIETSGDLKHNLFNFHTSRLTQPLPSRLSPNGHLPPASRRSSGSPTFFATGVELSQHPASALRQQLQASNPYTIPTEFSALQEQHRISLPIAVVLCRDSTLWTFDLPPKYGCVFLGYFNITQMDYSRMDADCVQCRMRLEWTPGGDSADPTAQPPLTPWWIKPDEPSTNEVDSEMVLHPYSFLPLHILAVSAFSDKDRAVGVSEVTSAEGWHCQLCGKLNIQRNLRLQRCSDCTRENGLPPIRVDCVRNPHLMAPSSWPWDKTYGNVVLTCRRQSDGSSTQTYTIESKAVVKHIYTCNRPEVQRNSSRLFKQIQQDTELVQRMASGWLAAGIHYIAMFGDSIMSDNSCTLWAGAPTSIAEARGLFQERCRNAGDWPSFEVSKMVVSAWMDVGSRKGCLLPAKRMRVAMYCLGADVELSISPQSLLGKMKEEKVTPVTVDLDSSVSLGGETSSGNSQNSSRGIHVKEEDSVSQPNTDLMAVDGSHSATALIQTDNSRTPFRLHTGASNGSSGASVRQKKETFKEPLFVTLVHGDMLLLEGDDFEYTLKRTGMSIVMIGTDTERQETEPAS